MSPVCTLQDGDLHVLHRVAGPGVPHGLLVVLQPALPAGPGLPGLAAVGSPHMRAVRDRYPVSLSHCILSSGGRRGRVTRWVRGWRLWKHFANFFPVRLVVTQTLDRNKNYLVCSTSVYFKGFYCAEIRIFYF